jgi:uncharacterized membrane protein YeiH
MIRRGPDLWQGWEALLSAVLALAPSGGPADAGLAVPVWLDAASAAVGGLFGALTAWRVRLDVMGTLLIALVTGLGGGLIRDTLLQRGTPVALTNPWLVPTALAAGLAGLLFAHMIKRMTGVLIVLDALFLGIYSIVGADKALRAELPIVSCVFLGVITGVGGGLLRDLMVGDRPVLLLPGAVYTTAAAVGAAAFTIAVATGGRTEVWFLAALGLVVILRLASLRWGWNTPQPDAVNARFDSIVMLPRRVVRSGRTVRRAAPRKRTDPKPPPQPAPADDGPVHLD